MSIEGSRIGYEILSYLTEHPDSGDTIEGIVQWWLLERKIEYQIAEVKEALEEYVTRGLVIEHRGESARTLYRLNQEKHEEIQALLKRG